jgi:hypothetical protein
MKHLTLCLLAISTLSGCNWIGRQADTLGSHMPVIGERCEHWQCITESGRQKSDMYKAQQRAEQEKPTQQEAAPYKEVEQQPAQPAYPESNYYQQ